MRTIFKYKLQLAERQLIDMPEGAIMKSVEFQRSELCVWCEIPDDKAKKVARLIRIIGTGHPIDEAESLTFIGTVQQLGGSLVWHIFESL